jgi:hypothetical protein
VNGENVAADQEKRDINMYTEVVNTNNNHGEIPKSNEKHLLLRKFGSLAFLFFLFFLFFQFSDFAKLKKNGEHEFSEIFLNKKF